MTEEETLQRRKALFYTNAAYALCDIANSFFMDAESALKKLDKKLIPTERDKFKRAMETARKARKATRAVCNVLYTIPDAEEATDEADYLAEVIKMVIDRTGDTKGSQRNMLRLIGGLPSVMHIYEHVKSEI